MKNFVASAGDIFILLKFATVPLPASKEILEKRNNSN